eukprot:12579238-Ditylum_brightwellii.AAC.1
MLTNKVHFCAFRNQSCGQKVYIPLGKVPFQAFNHFLHHHNKEAYINTAPSSPTESYNLTGFSKA